MSDKYYISEDSNSKGRHCKASSDLKCGELLFKEESFSSIPLNIVGDNGGNSNSVINTKLCMMCCQLLAKDKPAIPCTYGCGYTFCSTDCSVHLVHQLECSFIGRVIQSSRQCPSTDLSLCLLVLRIVIKKHVHEELWHSTVSKLSSQKATFKNQFKVKWIDSYYSFADKLIAYLKEDKVDKSLLSFFAREEIVDIMCQLVINSFAETRDNQRVSSGFFYQSALLNHSCNQPNTFFVINGDKLEMRCVKEIKKDQGIFDSYVDLLEPTYERQQQLLASKNFFCQCERCKDPSECGRHLSSIKCPTCVSESWICPIITFNEKELKINREWKCLNKECKTSKEQIDTILAQVDQVYKYLELKEYKTNVQGYIDRLTQLYQPLNNAIHANHYIVLKYNLGMANAHAKVSNYTDAITHAKKVKSIVKIILGKECLRGELVDCYEYIGDLFEKQFIHLLAKRQQSVQNNESSDTIVSNQALKQYLMESNRYYKKACDVSLICSGNNSLKSINLLALVKKTGPSQSTI